MTEREKLIKEINHCRAVLKNNAGEYTANAIERLIIAHMKLEQIS